MPIQFENLDVWRRGCQLSVALYQSTRSCSDFSFRDQVTRAGLSIPSNIAEGYERESKAELIRFLRIAKGSAGELRTQLYIGIEAGLLTIDIGSKFAQEALEISRMLAGLIKFQQRHSF